MTFTLAFGQIDPLDLYVKLLVLKCRPLTFFSFIYLFLTVIRNKGGMFPRNEHDQSAVIVLSLMAVLFMQVSLSSTAWTGPSPDRSHPQWEVRCRIAGHPQSRVRLPCPPASKTEGRITIRTKVPLSLFIPHVPERIKTSSSVYVLLIRQRQFKGVLTLCTVVLSLEPEPERDCPHSPAGLHTYCT